MSIDGMNNRIKTNLSLKNKSNKYRKAYFNQVVNLKEKFKFKEPTEDDLLRTQKSNQAFLENEKRSNLILLTLSFIVAFIAFLLLF